MKTTALRILLAASLSLSAFAASADAPVTSKAVGHPEDYKVFIDARTGYAFVRTPSRWVFTRKVDSGRVAETSVEKHLDTAELAR
ncbi:hypothetical protein [Methyloversatilis sp.]|uniref:hypothetical protein n=1 Tax=Methyloversatilis sp. TaxID=2569862 RepID=UPI0027344881|nr:hypothetical protein [Methyloversatilis sp.]MDP3456481.1 hypothetical protein [Methyloversatilis sp.]MDP3576755.1 hypothetical protein [Methyloversatilis sp.]